MNETIEAIDRERNIEVRSQIDRKILERLRPWDLFYQILAAACEHLSAKPPMQLNNA